MAYTKEDIIRIVKEEDIEFIRMQFTDIFGQLKNVAITASQIEKAVNNQIMLDGSSIEGFVRISTSIPTWTPLLCSPGGRSTVRWPDSSATSTIPTALPS